MNFIDEKHGAFLGLQLVQHRLQPLLEVAAIAGAGQQRAHVERPDRGIFQHFWNFALHDFAGQAFCDGGFADAGIAHIERVVLGPAAENLDRALHFAFAADQRVDFAGRRLVVQIDAIGFERTTRLFLFAAVLLGALVLALLGLPFGPRSRTGIRRTPYRPALGAAASLGDAMRDEVDRVEPRHVMALQEIDRVAFPFAEQRHQDVRARHLLAPRRLHVNVRPLEHALETGRRFRLVPHGGHQRTQVFVHIVGDRAAQIVDIDAAGAKHVQGVLVIQKRQQEMLQGGVFVLALAGKQERAMQSLFKSLR